MADLKQFQTGRVIVFPYIEDKAPEDVLYTLYKKAKENNSDALDSIFYGTGMGRLTLNKFIRALAGKPMMIGAIRHPNGRDMDLAGFGWLWQVEGVEGARKANVAYTFFRQYWGTTELRDITGLVLRWWYEELKVDTLFGTIADSNRLALNFSRRLGFRVLGKAERFFIHEGKFEAGWMVQMDKEEFLAKGR